MIQTIVPIMALLLSVGLMMIGHGLQTTILPIRANIESFSDIAVGVISSSYFAGFVCGCLFSPYAVLRAGHIRAFAAIVSMASAASLAYILSVDPLTWTLSRTIFGFCIAGFYIIVESWLNERTTNDTRGLIMSIYVVINFGAIMLGQGIVTVSNHSTFAPFVIASILVSIAVLPVSLTRAAQPAPITLVRFRPKEIYKLSPAAVVGSFFVGIATGSLWTLAPLYALRIGLDADTAAYYSLVMILGGAIAQWPVGRLSDKIDRRVVLLFLCIAASILCVFTAVFPQTMVINALVGGLVVGTVTQPAYAVVVAHCYDQIDPEKDSFVETASGLLLVFGAGSTIGPIVATIIMNAFPMSGLYGFVAVIEITLTAYLFWRIRVRSYKPEEEKTDWNLATTAPVGGVITADPLDESDPDVVLPSKYKKFEQPTEAEVAEAWETGAEELEQVITSSEDESAAASEADNKQN